MNTPYGEIKMISSSISPSRKLLLSEKKSHFHQYFFFNSGLNMAEFRPSSADGYGDAPGLRPGPVYDLFGVVNHYGGMYSGHYTAYAKSVYEGKDYGWRCFDDSRVSRVDSEDIVSRSGYILFYRIRE